MKKQLFSAPLLLMLALVIALPVLAEERGLDSRGRAGATSTNSTERRVEMQQDLAKEKAERTAKVLLATIGRLEKIITRIESRITKIQARGGNTIEAQSFVSAAKRNLTDARVAVDAFANLDLSGSTARDNFKTVRVAATEAREQIRTAHRNLMMATRALKGPNTGIERERKATSTATSTSDSD